MIVIVPILLFLAVLAFVVVKRRRDPDGELGTDPQAHKNLGRHGGPPMTGPGGRTTGGGGFGR